MQVDEISKPTRGSNPEARKRARPSLIFGLVLLLVISFGCAPPAPGDATQSDSSTSGSGDRPEITDELVYERINETYVREVPVADGDTGDPIVWNFDYDEPKEIRVIEKKVDGNRATLVLDIKTRSAPEMRVHRQLEGQIRTEWELTTGWVLRRWEIVRTENISMKYKDLAKPPSQNSNANQKK